jgi:methylmalonyl-CoA mutase
MQNEKESKKLFSIFPPISTEAWLDKLKTDLKTDDPLSKLMWHCADGLNFRAIYRAEDAPFTARAELMPASWPFLRGYKGHNDWEINRIIETPELEQANELALKAIARGANSIEFNCAKVRKFIDLSILLKGIDIEKIAVRFDKPLSFKIILKHLITFVESEGFSKSKIRGSFNWDAMAYRLISGKYYQTLDDNVDELKDLIEESNSHFPHFKVLSINAQHFHNAGATVVDELAFTLSAGVEYLQRLLDKGMGTQEVLKHFVFRMAIGPAYFMEIAKFRSLRYLWSKVVSAYDSQAKEESKASIFALSGQWNKTIFDPYVNMLRTTTETMSAAIAGVDIMTVSAYDATFRFDNDFSSRIAQNQQILVKEEAHFDKVVDAAAGSYFIENISSSLIEYAWEMFNKVEELGGFAHCMETDFIKNIIALTAEKKWAEVANRRTNILGTNQFPNQQEWMLEQIERQPKAVASGLRLGRAAEDFERLRLQTESHFQLTNERPHVLLISFGDLNMRKARAAFSSNFFACAAYEISEIVHCTSATQAYELAKENRAEIVVFCSSDLEYLDFVSNFNQTISNDYHPIQVVAGNPIEQIAALKMAGIQEFIHLKTNVIDCLQSFNARLFPSIS